MFQTSPAEGYAYAELLDFSDVSEFDGILIKVFEHVDKKVDQGEMDISEISLSKIRLGPLPVNKYPAIRGKNCWSFLGKGTVLNDEPPFF